MKLFEWNRKIFISRLPASNWTGRATGRKDQLVKQMNRLKKKLDWLIYRLCFISPTGPLKKRPTSLISRPMCDQSKIHVPQIACDDTVIRIFIAHFC